MFSCLGMFGLVALDFGLIVRIVYVATVPDLLSPFWAVVIGCILAAVVCVVFITGQGNTVMEFVVPSLILLVLLMILYPVAAQMPGKRRYNLQKRSFKQLKPRSSVRQESVARPQN